MAVYDNVLWQRSWGQKCLTKKRSACASTIFYDPPCKGGQKRRYCGRVACVGTLVWVQLHRLERYRASRDLEFAVKAAAITG